MLLSIYVSGNSPDARLAESLLDTQALLCAHAEQSSFVILISIINYLGGGALCEKVSVLGITSCCSSVP